MAELTWDELEGRLYETGIDHGVLYVSVDGAYPAGVAWSGLTGVTESPSGAEATAPPAARPSWASYVLVSKKYPIGTPR